MQPAVPGNVAKLDGKTALTLRKLHPHEAQVVPERDLQVRRSLIAVDL
jgi:hypothetical protein